MTPSLTFKNQLPRDPVAPGTIYKGWNLAYRSGLVETPKAQYLAQQDPATGAVFVFLHLGGWREINEASAFRPLSI